MKSFRPQETFKRNESIRLISVAEHAANWSIHHNPTNPGGKEISVKEALKLIDEWSESGNRGYTWAHLGRLVVKDKSGNYWLEAEISSNPIGRG